MDTLDEYHLHLYMYWLNIIHFGVDNRNRVYYSHCYFNRHSLSSFQVQLLEQYLVKKLSSKNMSLYIFPIFTEFSRDFWEMNGKSWTER